MKAYRLKCNGKFVVLKVLITGVGHELVACFYAKDDGIHFMTYDVANEIIDKCNNIFKRNKINYPIDIVEYDISDDTLVYDDFHTYIRQRRIPQVSVSVE